METLIACSIETTAGVKESKRPLLLCIQSGYWVAYKVLQNISGAWYSTFTDVHIIFSLYNCIQVPPIS